MTPKLSNSPSIETKTHQQNATIVLVLLAVVYALATGFYIPAILQQPIWQFYAGAIVSAILFVACLVGLIFSRSGRPHLAILFFIPFTWVIYPYSAFILKGIGITLGISQLLATFPITLRTLPRRTALVVSLISILNSIGTILLDVYGPAERPSLPALLSSTFVQLAIAAIVALLLVAGGVLLNRQLANLGLNRKFLVISALFTLPLVVTVGLFANQQYTRIDQYGYRELYGTYYLRPLQKMLEALGRHALALDDYTVSEGQKTTFAEIQAAEAEIDGYFAELKTLNDQYGPVLKTTESLGRLQTEWAVFKNEILKTGLSNREEDYRTLGNSIRNLITLVGDTSYLILDPDLVTYYPMDAVLLRLPESAMLIDQTALVGGAAVLRDNLTAGDRVRLQTATTRLAELEAGMGRGLDVAYANDASGTMRATLEPVLTKYRTSLQQYNSLINNSIAAEPNIPFEREQLHKQTALTAQAHAELSTTLSQVLEAGIQNRITNLSLQLGGLIGFSLLAGVLALFFGVLIFRSIAQPVAQLTQATRELAAGDLGVRVNLPGTDEASQLALSFNNMARRLQESQTEITRRARALEASAEVTRRLSTILSEEALVRAVVTELQAAFNYYHAHIYLFDEAQEFLEMRGGTGEAGQLLLERGHKIHRGRGLVGRAADTKAPVLVGDTKQDPNWLPNPLLPDTRSELAVPILLGNSVLGVIDVQQNTVNGLQGLDADLLESVAGQVAIALQNARSFTSSQRRATRETFLNELNRKLQAATSLERVLEIATQELGQTLGARRAQGQLQMKATDQKQARWQ